MEHRLLCSLINCTTPVWLTRLGVLTPSNHDWKRLIPIVPQAVNLFTKRWLEKPNETLSYSEWGDFQKSQRGGGQGQGLMLFTFTAFPSQSWFTLPLSSSLLPPPVLNAPLHSFLLLFTNFIQPKKKIPERSVQKNQFNGMTQASTKMGCEVVQWRTHWEWFTKSSEVLSTSRVSDWILE